MEGDPKERVNGGVDMADNEDKMSDNVASGTKTEDLENDEFFDN